MLKELKQKTFKCLFNACQVPLSYVKFGDGKYLKMIVERRLHSNNQALVT